MYRYQALAASTVKRFARPAVICCVVISVVAVSTGLYLYHRSRVQSSGSTAIGNGTFKAAGSPQAHPADVKGTPAASQGPTWAPSSAPPLMAGESLWHGVPSMLWGSNDTQIWDSQHSLITESAIQQEAKADHLALMRVWLFQTDLATNLPETDVYQESKVRASLGTGAKLLCELPTENTMSYDEHMVTLFKGQCSYYEFMNEPDDEQVPISTYVSEWSSEIPILRSIDPQAKFGGPAVAAPQYSQCTYGIGTTVCYMQKVLDGMAASKVLPDFVTFHWYPCWEETVEPDAQGLRAEIGRGVDEDVATLVAHQDRRPHPVVARVGGSADGAVAADGRHPHAGSRTENCDLQRKRHLGFRRSRFGHFVRNLHEAEPQLGQRIFGEALLFERQVSLGLLHQDANQVDGVARQVEVGLDFFLLPEGHQPKLHFGLRPHGKNQERKRGRGQGHFELLRLVGYGLNVAHQPYFNRVGGRGRFVAALE